MTELDWLTIALLTTAGIVVVLWLTIWIRSRHKDPAELERRRREFLKAHGRICEGRVLELLETGNGAAPLVLYGYEVSGVEYQAAQDLSFLGDFPVLARCAAGQVASVKFDPQNPSNSIIVAEEWSGV